LDTFVQKAKLKIIDFWNSKQLTHQWDLTHTYCGSLSYMAPEISECTGYGYGNKVDIYAAALTWNNLI
jgi:serine/threonine protein kinase